MAFNPERLSLLVQPIGDGGIRFFGYQTDDAEATVTAASYATNASDYGLRTYDLIVVTPLSGAEDTYILAVDTIDADGHATLASPGPIGDLLAANNLSDVANAATALANLGGMAKATSVAGLAALSPTLHSGVSLVGTDQDGEFTPFDNTGGSYNSDLTDDVNSGFVFNGVAPYVWVRRPDWYLDGEHFRLGATADDTDAMQGFLNIAARRGRIAMLPPTQFYTDTVTVPSDIHIMGRGSQSIWSPVSSLGNTSPMMKNGTQGSYTDENIILENFVVDGDGLGNEQATQTRVTALAIFTRVTGLHFRKMTGRNFGYILFSCGSSKRIRVDGGDYSGIGYTGATSNGGVCFWFAQLSTDFCEDVVVRGANFHDNLWTPIQLNGKQLIVVGNTFRNNKEAHIYSSHDTTTTYLRSIDAIIANNTMIGLRLKDITAVAIETGGYGGAIYGNTIEDCDHGGIALTNPQHFSCHNNIIRNTSLLGSGAAIAINSTWTGSRAPKDIKVHNNIIYDNQTVGTTRYGIRTIKTTGDDIANAEIYDNNLSGPFTIGAMDVSSGWASSSRRWNNKGSSDEWRQGTYTPTLTNVTNIDATVAAVMHYEARGNQVTVWGPMQVDPTAGASTGSEVGISLPIASNLAASADLNGFGSASTVAQPFRIEADPTNDRAKLVFSSMTTANMLVAVRFSYEIK